MLQSLRKNKVVKNAGWIIGGKVANKLLAFVVGIFAARYLGPSNYGLINYAAAYAAFFASLCTLGINSVIVKNFVDHPDQQGETIGTTLLLRAISSLLSALAIIGIVSVVDRGERLTIVVVALYSIGLIFQVFDTLNYWFQARLQSKYSAIAELVSYAAMSVYKIICLRLGKAWNGSPLQAHWITSYLRCFADCLFQKWRNKIPLLSGKSKGASAKQRQLYHSRADGLHLCLYR